MVIYITRHAQPDPDFKPTAWRGLTELGRIQSEKLGQRLAADGFGGVIYTSPYHRCLETAQIICEQTGGVFFPEPNLGEIAREWILKFEGLTINEIRNKYPACAPSAELVWPWWPSETETYDDVLVRVGRWLNALVVETKADILLVAHGASAGRAYQHLAQTEEAQGHFNAGLSAIQIHPIDKQLFQNDVSHLGQGEATSNKEVVG